MQHVPRHRHEGDAPLGQGPPARPTPGSAHHRPRLSRDAATERSITIPRKAFVLITIARVDRVPPVARARTDSFRTLSFLLLFAFLAMRSRPPSFPCGSVSGLAPQIGGACASSSTAVGAFPPARTRADRPD